MIFPGASANTRRANRRISETAWNLGRIGAWHPHSFAYLELYFWCAKQGLLMSPWTGFLFHSGRYRIPYHTDWISWPFRKRCRKKNAGQCDNKVGCEHTVNSRMTQHRLHCCTVSLGFVNIICFYLEECPSSCNSHTHEKWSLALGIVIYTRSETCPFGCRFLDGSRDALVSQDGKYHCCCKIGGGEQRNTKTP